MVKVNNYYTAFRSTLKTFGSASIRYEQAALVTENVRGNIVSTLQSAFVACKKKKQKLVDAVKSLLEADVWESVLYPEVTAARDTFPKFGTDLDAAFSSLKQDVSILKRFITARQGVSSDILTFAQTRIDMIRYCYEKLGILFEQVGSATLTPFKWNFSIFVHVAIDKINEVYMGIMEETCGQKVRREELEASRTLTPPHSRPFTSDRIPMWALDRFNSADALRKFMAKQNEYPPSKEVVAKIYPVVRYLQTRQYPALDYLRNNPAGSIPDSVLLILRSCTFDVSVHNFFAFTTLHFHHLLVKKIFRHELSEDYKTLRRELHGKSVTLRSNIRERMMMCSFVGSVYHVDRTVTLSIRHNLFMEILLCQSNSTSIDH